MITDNRPPLGPPASLRETADFKELQRRGLIYPADHPTSSTIRLFRILVEHIEKLEEQVYTLQMLRNK